ncbi:hypothetical protein WJX82_006123 [Trebouxia sp. C0006]
MSSNKSENGQELPFPLPSEVAQPVALAQMPEQAPEAAGTPESTKQSSLAQDVAGLSRTKLSGGGMLDGMGLSTTDVELAQNLKGRNTMDCLQEFTQQEMAEAVARRQGADATAYQRLYQFAFASCTPASQP